MKIQTLGLTPPQRRSAGPLDNPVNSLNNPANWIWLTGGRETDAGEIISEETALKISTCYACIRILAESVASLPVKLLRVTPQGKIHEQNDPLAYLLAVSPNGEQTSFVFFETLTVHLMLTGNAYAQIERAADGRPVALWLLNPRLTRPVRLPSNDLSYETTDGEQGTTARTIPAKDMLHVPLTSLDGIVGLSPIQQAARSLGLAAAATRFGSRLFANYAMPQVALLTKQQLKPETKAQVRQGWEQLQTGINQHRVAVLDQEMDIKTLSITPDEAQFLQTRIHERSEVAAIFRVPLHLVGDTTKLANASIEGQNLSFIIDTLRPILSRIEAEFVRKLMPGAPGQPSTLTMQFDITERQRGDTAAQVALIAAGRQWGALTANDVLRMLGMPVSDAPCDDQRMVPVNMQNSERLLAPPALSSQL